MSFPSDPWLDAKLRNVPLPVGMLARLGDLTAANDEQLDAALGDVPLPPGFLDRLARIPRRTRRRSTARTFAVAASLMVGLGLAIWGGAEVLVALRQAEPHAQQPGLAKVPPAEAHAPTTELPDEPADRQLADQLVEQPPNSEASDAPLAGELAPLVEGPVPYWPDPPRRRSAGADSIFASDRRFDSDLELQRLPEVAPLGISPPRVRGYDLLFQLRHGDHPLVSPAAHESLRSVLVPLVSRTGSFEQTWRHVRQGRLPPPESVRVEEFLAAIDYEFAPPSQGALTIRTAAGPSPLGASGASMLQVGVQARAPGDHRPLDLTVAVDTSNSMGTAGRLDMVRRALAGLAKRLSASDRLTLVAFGDDAQTLLNRAGPDQRERILAAVDALEPLGGTNLGAGLSAACEAALSGSGARRLVVITDGLAELDQDAARRLEQTLARAAASGATTSIVEVAGQRTADPQLAQLATAGGGKVLQVDSSLATGSLLAELLSGQPQTAAVKTTLKVTFNPDAVALYRLLGHEAASLTSPTGPDREVSLDAAQQASGLFELWLKPAGDDVATVELTWTEPAGGKQQRRTQRVSRVQFAKAFEESPLSLQAAVIAAETAESLRGSYFASTPRGLGRVLELAWQMHSRLAERPSMRDFMALVEQAEQVRKRGASSPKSPDSTAR